MRSLTRCFEAMCIHFGPIIPRNAIPLGGSKTRWQSPMVVYVDLLIPHSWFLCLWNPRFLMLDEASCKHDPPWNVPQAKFCFQNKVDEVNRRWHLYRFVFPSFTKANASELVIKASGASVGQLPTMRSPQGKYFLAPKTPHGMEGQTPPFYHANFEGDASNDEVRHETEPWIHERVLPAVLHDTCF